jgi:hypothetical protein
VTAAPASACRRGAPSCALTPNVAVFAPIPRSQAGRILGGGRGLGRAVSCDHYDDEAVACGGRPHSGHVRQELRVPEHGGRVADRLEALELPGEACGPRRPLGRVTCRSGSVPWPLLRSGRARVRATVLARVPPRRCPRHGSPRPSRRRRLNSPPTVWRCSPAGTAGCHPPLRDCGRACVAACAGGRSAMLLCVGDGMSALRQGRSRAGRTAALCPNRRRWISRR